MDTRQHLVEAWKAQLEANSQPPATSGERFSWVRQIYSRIYRFLVSCYGEGQWRGAGDDSSANAGFSSTATHMPFVDHCPMTDGLAPKSPERIRAALKSIHDSNPGIATAGTMIGISDDAWVVVAAERKPQYARFIHRRLVTCGIEACLQDRTTDMAVVVRYEDFPDALAIVQGVKRPKRNVFTIRRKVDPLPAVGLFLLISSVLTFLAYVLLNDTPPPAMPLVVCALWIAGLASAWLYVRGRRLC